MRLHLFHFLSCNFETTIHLLQVLVAEADILKHPLAETWAKLIQLVQQKDGYSYIMASSSSFGKNILPRAAALLDVSPVTDVVEISEPRLFVRFLLIPPPCSHWVFI